MTTDYFQRVYPFTTEEIAGYFQLLDFKNKSVFTVGSSSDQAFNALLLGAKNITVYDINENTAKFGKLKREKIISNTSRRKMYEDVLSTDDIPYSKDIYSYKSLTSMNPYMSSSKSYRKLQRLLEENPNSIKYVTGNIMDLSPIKNKKYDVILLSNVLQYLDLYIEKGKDPYEELKKVYLSLKEHLNEDGVLQLLYYYILTKNNFMKSNNYPPTSNITNVMRAINDELLLETFDVTGSCNRKDAIITYQKRKQR